MKLFNKYLKFFIDCEKERYIHCCGSRRSGKTINTFLWLRMLGRIRQKPITIIVCDSTSPALKNTIGDFTLATGLYPKSSLLDGISCRDENILWRFLSFDDGSKCQGVRGDYLFVNEAVRVQMEVLEVLVQGITCQVYFNYNPTKKSGIERWINDKNFIRTTWKDNPHLTEAQKDEFRNLKIRAEKPNATKRDIFLYTVYYLGEFSDISGAVFDNINKISYEEYRNIPVLELFGMDFGFASSASADPTTLVGCKYYKDRIYCHQYIYESGLVNNAALAHKMVQSGVDYHSIVLADYGGLGKERINTLVSADNGTWTDPEIRCGFQIYNAQKTTIFDGVMEMLSTDGIYVTNSSTALIDEFEGYEYTDKQKFSGADHGIDALRYVFHYYKNFWSN